MRIAADAVGEHPYPGFALAVSVAEAECHEGKPCKEGQALEQRAVGNAAGYAEQGTVGSHRCEQNQDEHDDCYSCVAKKTRLADCLSERKQALLYRANQHLQTEDKHHQAAVQAVAGMTEEPAQALAIKDAAAGYGQCRQDPRKEWQQGSQHQAEDESSLSIVHRLRGCPGRGCATV